MLVGDALLLAAFAGAVWVNLHMGEHWRSGARDDARVRLVTDGPFARTRNPMMVAVLTGQLGFFLALPSLFALVCLAVGTWAVVAQVGVEERSLARQFGNAYADYRARTPRWLPLGRV